MRFYLTLFILLVAHPLLFAQSERYELGRRLKQFEQAWEKQPDEKSRLHAAALLPDITSMFFSLRFGDAGQTLDRARWTLAADQMPTPEIEWLESLYAYPERALYTDEAEILITVKPFYKVKADAPAKAEVLLQWNQEKPITVPMDKFPTKITIPFKPSAKQGVGRLKFIAKLDDKVIKETVQRISFARDLTAQLETIRAFAKQKPATIESATLKDRIELLEELTSPLLPETDLPGLALLEEAKLISKTPRYFNASRPGQYWLSIPMEKKTLPLRMFVPKGLDLKKPVPLVVALHGAGGSENLFFEGYGAGHIVKECEKRGWLLVAPRSPLGFSSGPPVKELIEQLADRYPIDRSKVFVVGHSMGAAQTVALCQAHPGLFAAAAALGGGGGRVKQAAFANTPFFIGVGDKDFARPGAVALSKALPQATFKEYPGIEHMLIVRVALPDVFAEWDRK